MAWLAVITAGLLEVGFATMLNFSITLQSCGQVLDSYYSPRAAFHFLLGH